MPLFLFLMEFHIFTALAKKAPKIIGAFYIIYIIGAYYNNITSKLYSVLLQLGCP